LIGPKDMVTQGHSEPTFDRTKLRLGLFGIIVLAAFIALFSRLWFLQVLASDDFQKLASENRIREVQSDVERGRILDRNGVVLVDNRASQTLTVDRNLLDHPIRKQHVLKKLSVLLETPVKEFNRRLHDLAASLYKPVAIANDVPKKAVKIVSEYPEDYPGVNVENRFVRTYPQGKLAAQILGYTGEITEEQLGTDTFKKGYQPGDVVGRSGLELMYDSLIRGKPRTERVVVNSTGSVVGSKVTQDSEPGKDLVLSLDARIQKITEKALAAGIYAARGSYNAPDGAAVVLDPDTGGVIATASFPTFDPEILADGYSFKDQKFLAGDPSDPDNHNDDLDLNRVIQSTVNPGSTFKVATAGAAMATGVMGPFDYRDCPGALQLSTQLFHNWTSIDMGPMGIPKSLEVSCDTFYYELGWEMENKWGAGNGDGTEKFQDYLRTAGFGHETGIDLPSENGGLVPDEDWCLELARANEDLCVDGWVPGMSVNMSIGQGDLLATPLQMAVTYAALVNGGNVLKPHLGGGLGVPDAETGEEQSVKEFDTKVASKLPLDETEMGVIRDGLVDVITGPEGTGGSAFVGFPLDRYPIAGKTGTAQYSATSDLNRAWFVSYAPLDDPQYVVAVYLDQAGHGGESAAPVARQIYEGIFNLDNKVEAGSGTDRSD
jgi:penicillin-binding protein 2